MNLRSLKPHARRIAVGLLLAGAAGLALTSGTPKARTSPTSSQAKLDRIVALPTQLTTYDTGGLELFALRAKAERALGRKFDIRSFHSEILRYGAVTVPMLREIVDRWIAARSK